MSQIRGAAAYRRIEAESRSPLELVVLLYDGLLRFLADARRAGEDGDPVRRGHAVSRALAIVGELQSTLDLTRGEATAVELDRLYDYVTGRLIDVTSKQDTAALDEVERLLRPLRDAWAEIAQPAPVAVSR